MVISHCKMLWSLWKFISVQSLIWFLPSGSGSFSLPGSADLFLGVPPVNGEQSAYPMGMQVLDKTSKNWKKKSQNKLKSVMGSKIVVPLDKVHNPNSATGKIKCTRSGVK